MSKRNLLNQVSAAPVAKVERRLREIRITGLCAADGSGTMADQCQAALEQGRMLLEAGQLTMSDVTRVAYLITDADEFSACVPVFRRMFPQMLPALTFTWAGSGTLSVPHAVIELAFYVERPEAFL